MIVTDSGSAGYRSGRYVGNKRKTMTFGSTDTLSTREIEFFREERAFEKNINRIDNELRDIIRELDVNSGHADLLVALRKSGDIAMARGRTEEYIMAHPVMKELWRNNAITRDDYIAREPDRHGIHDPMYRRVYKDNVMETGNGDLVHTTLIHDDETKPLKGSKRVIASKNITLIDRYLVGLEKLVDKENK